MKKTLHTSLSEIPALAEQLAHQLHGGEILALTGNLGSGKTTFTKTLGKLLKVKKPITSPTFVLMNQYTGKTRSGEKITIYHLDLYRMATVKEFEGLGVSEWWGDKNTLTIIEWAEKIRRRLPKKTISIHFKNL